jgi:pimeloyl-ACP methyl ester carboxylesterase
MRDTTKTSARLTIAVGLVALALLAAGCSSDGGDGAGAGDETSTTEAGGPSTTAADVDPASFEEGECWWEVPADLPAGTTVTCGSVEVPADRAGSDAEMITLAVARIHREGSPEDAPPILYLHGGPGGDVLGTAPTGLMNLDALDDRDLIAFDQRGAGRSTPSLNCPEKELAVLDALGAAKPWAEELAANREAVSACYERLTGDGIDLDDYDTPASVADMESIRAAFDVDTWDLWGGSYGTRLGLAYAREHPDQVRSLLIDSVYSPDVGSVERSQALPVEAVARLAEACAAQESCASAHGDLGAKLDQAIAAFDQDPEDLTGEVLLGEETVSRSFTLTGPDVLAGMFAALYDSDLIPSLPGVIASLSEGDRSIISAFVSTGVPRLIDLTEGAFYSVECADSGRLMDEAAGAAALVDPGELALVALGTAETFCADWPVEHVPAAFNDPVTVDVPTLVFGGTLDPITPYAESVAQAERMPDARFVSVPNGGHGVGGFDDCTRSARQAFWDDPASDLPTCATSIEAVPFS